MTYDKIKNGSQPILNFINTHSFSQNFENPRYRTLQKSVHEASPYKTKLSKVILSNIDWYWSTKISLTKTYRDY